MPKEKLTKELVREAVTLVQNGASNKDVIAYLGVNQATFYRWLNTPKTENQRELCKLLKKAETERKVWHLQRIHKAAEEGNWQASSPAMQWMAEHCAEYGFIIRYPEDKEDVTEINYEPWHLRYVGNPAATYIMENGLCLEEFHQQLQEAIDLFLQDGGRESLVRDLIQTSADDQ